MNTKQIAEEAAEGFANEFKSIMGKRLSLQCELRLRENIQAAIEKVDEQWRERFRKFEKIEEKFGPASQRAAHASESISEKAKRKGWTKPVNSIGQTILPNSHRYKSIPALPAPRELIPPSGRRDPARHGMNTPNKQNAATAAGNAPRELMRGLEVMIYQDPITERKPEGLAKLSTYLKTDGCLEQWNVRFVHEREVYPRWIKKP